MPAPLLFVDVQPATVDGKIDLCPEELDAATPFGLFHYQPDPGTERFPIALISPAIAQQISSTFGQLRKAPATVELVYDTGAGGAPSSASGRAGSGARG